VNDDEAMRPFLHRRRGREEDDEDGVKPRTTITAKKTNEKKRTIIPRPADRMVSNNPTGVVLTQHLGGKPKESLGVKSKKKFRRHLYVTIFRYILSLFGQTLSLFGQKFKWRQVGS
jgi:hypothetical protein